MTRERCGKLIAVEGIDGAGKSLLANTLAFRLEQSHRAVTLVTRYMIPDLTEFWRLLVNADAVDQHSAATMAAADHWLGLRNEVEPALQSGRHVVADRFYYSHLVYFSLRGIDLNHLLRLFSFVTEPDLVLYLSIEPETAERRLHQKGKPDFWESGLDCAGGITIGEAYRAYGNGKTPDEFRLRSYREMQRRSIEAYQRVLPRQCTVILNGDLPAADLADRAMRSIVELPIAAEPCFRNG